MKALSLEWYKSRRRGFWLVVLAMCAVVFFWMIVGLDDMDAGERARGYAFCLYQAPLLNAIVLPVMIGVLVSRACDMEHKGSTLKSLFTMQTPQSLFTAKFVCTGIYLLVAVILQAASFVAIAEIFGFTEPLPTVELLLYMLSQWLVSLFLALLIQTLSLNYVNQFIPLVTGLIGGFLGLMAMFFPPAVMRLVPSSYYGLLSTVRMDWDPSTRIMDLYYVDFSLPDCALLCAAGLALFIFARSRFMKREV